jgi:thiol-disulfide isomerase/thioredoxin
MAENTWRTKMSRSRFLLALTSSILLCAPAIAGTDKSFTQAKKDFDKGDYEKALDEFRVCEQAHPDNTLTRYYIAVCFQQMGKPEQASKEYNYVLNYGNDRLRALASVGLANLRQSGSHASGVKFVPSSHAATYAGLQAPLAPAKKKPAKSGAKVSKVIEFYTGTSAACKDFEPTYDRAKAQFPAITFQKIDSADSHNEAIVKQYSVQAFPTLVFLDEHDKVLESLAGAPADGNHFLSLLDKLSAK